MFPSASAGGCSSHAKSTPVRPPAAGQRGANSTAPASSLLRSSLRSSAEWSASREVVVGKFKIHGLSADLGFRLPSFPTFPHEHPLSCFFGCDAKPLFNLSRAELRRWTKNRWTKKKIAPKNKGLSEIVRLQVPLDGPTVFCPPSLSGSPARQRKGWPSRR